MAEIAMMIGHGASRYGAMLSGATFPLTSMWPVSTSVA
jgi:hypothetical protein